MKLTAHFTTDEVTRSKTAKVQGIDNSVPLDLVKNVELTSKHMEQVRIVIGCPVVVKSWFRSKVLNTAIGGAKNSAHMSGSAVDFDPAIGTNKDAFYKIAASSIPFDQLIQESTADGVDWIHIGFNHQGNPRREVLLAQGAKFGGTMKYTRVSIS